MKLDRVDQLSTSALHHHLVAAEIRRREKLESFRDAIELQAVILPDAQDPRRSFRIRAVDVFEDRIFGIGDPDEAVLVFLRSRRTLLVLLELVERDHARAKTQTDKLMTTAYGEYRNLCLANEFSKFIEDRLVVIIKIAQRAAQHDRAGLKTFRGPGDFRKVRDVSCRTLNQARDVVENVFNSHPGDHSLSSHFGGECRAPLSPRH